MAKKTTTTKTKASANGANGKAQGDSPRLSVMKTYKLYVGGKFPRTESGRYYELRDKSDKLVANVCRASRKDFRDAVRGARKAFDAWSQTTALLKGQILYRIAEMVEARRDEFVRELEICGLSTSAAQAEVNATVDRWVHYAGWCDKYPQLFGTVNPVASSHFNFSMPEPTGVVSAFAPENSPLLGLVSVIAPVIAGGNSIIILADKDYPTPAITLGEVLAHSDLPGGVVNILTGYRDELLGHFASHMDVNAMVLASQDEKEIAAAQEKGVNNVKRVIAYRDQEWGADSAQGPYRILDFQEIKTTWHPVGI